MSGNIVLKICLVNGTEIAELHTIGREKMIN